MLILFLTSMLALFPRVSLSVDESPSPAVYEEPLGDIDGDGDVDMFDFALFAQAYGTTVGDDDYEVRIDFDNDGAIDMFDFGIFAQNYGKTV